MKLTLAFGYVTNKRVSKKEHFVLLTKCNLMILVLYGIMLDEQWERKYWLLAEFRQREGHRKIPFITK